MFCPGCFSEEIKDKCTACGYDLSIKRSPILLPHHTKLNQGRYLVGRLIGRLGGFGVTYLALDSRLQTIVAIKEYLPRDIAGREANQLTVHSHTSDDEDTFKYGLTRFLDEARTLAKLDHPNIVRVRDFFEENGTAYLVMDYCQGLTLSEYIKRQPTGKVDPKQAVSIIIPILDGLREVHQKGFLHRDIKPQNIYLTSGNRPILLDFGAARQSMGERSKSLSVVLSEGFAPFEQYQRNGKQGSWTDIYGVAATLYNMVTGQVPPSAMDRIGDETLLPGLHSTPVFLRQALERGMHSSTANRTQDVDSFQKELLVVLEDVSPALKTSSGPMPPPTEGISAAPHHKETTPPRNSKLPSSGGSYFVSVILLIIGFASYSFLSQKNESGSLNKNDEANREVTIERHIASPSPPVSPPADLGRSPSQTNPTNQAPALPPGVFRNEDLFPPSQKEPEKPKLSAEDQEKLNHAKTAKQNMHSPSASSWKSNDYRRAAAAFREAARIEPANHKFWNREEASALKKAEEADQKLKEAGDSDNQPALKDAKLRKWASKNPWFGTEPSMTEHATKYSNSLLQSGIDPSSDRYFTMIDSEMRRNYPSYFQGGSSRSGGSSGSGADEKAKKWARRNPWFGTESSMTTYARTLHQKLVQGGVEPGSDYYYREIDSGMRKAFPEYFGGN